MCMYVCVCVCVCKIHSLYIIMNKERIIDLMSKVFANGPGSQC